MSVWGGMEGNRVIDVCFEFIACMYTLENMDALSTMVKT